MAKLSGETGNSTCF